MRSVLPRNFCPSAHIGGQVLTSEGQTGSLGRTFTTREASDSQMMVRARKAQSTVTTQIDKNRVKRSAPEAGFQAVNGGSAHHWGQFPTFEGKTDSHGRSFTIWHKLPLSRRHSFLA